MEDVLNSILSFFNGIVETIVGIFTWLLNGIVWLSLKLIYVTCDGFFSVIVAFINGINLNDVMPYIQSSWGDLPAQIIWLANAIGLPQGLGMLGSAYLIRMLLNLIPAAFTRI
jgi:hypothetical protein